MKVLTFKGREEKPPNYGLGKLTEEFETLLELLEAKFFLLPSSAHIVERKHGKLRCSLKLMSGDDFNDSEH